MKVIKYLGPFASRITNVSMYNQKSHQMSYFSIIFFFNRVVLQHKFKFLIFFFFVILSSLCCSVYYAIYTIGFSSLIQTVKHIQSNKEQNIFKLNKLYC